MSLKLKKENEVVFSFDHLIEDYLSVVDELALLISNIKKEPCGVLKISLSFWRKLKKKTCNMFFLILDPLYIIFSFIGKEQGVTIV